MSDSNPSNPPPSNLVRLQKRTPDYMKSEMASRQLVRAIRAYYAKHHNRDVKVWIEKERLGVGDFVWAVRSDILMIVPQV